MEGVVLLGVKHFEQGARGVAVVGHLRDFVNLVEDEDGVRRAGFGQALDDASGHGADVRLAVAANLGLVVHATQRDADVLASEGVGDALAERRLTHSGRAVEADDGRLHVPAQLEHGQVLDDALLHLLDAVVVAVEGVLGMGHVEVVVGKLVPRQPEQRLQVVELHVVVGRLGVGALQLHHLLLEQLGHVVAPLLPLCGVAHLGDVLILHAAAQLVLDVLELLLEEVLALLLAELLLGTCLDVLLQLRELHLAVEDGEQMCGALLQRGLGEQLCLLLDVEGEVGTDEVDQEDGVVDVAQGKDGVLLALDIELCILDSQLLAVVDDGAELAVVLPREDVAHGCHGGGHVGAALDDLEHLHPLYAVQDDGGGHVGHLEDADDASGSAHVVEVRLGGVLRFGRLLAMDGDGDFLLVGVLDELQRTAAADGDGHDDAGEQHHVAHRQHGQRLAVGVDDVEHVLVVTLVVGNHGKRRFIFVGAGDNIDSMLVHIVFGKLAQRYVKTHVLQNIFCVFNHIIIKKRARRLEVSRKRCIFALLNRKIYYYGKRREICCRQDLQRTV